MSIAVYSAIYGPYDSVKPAPRTSYPCYMYTDSDETAAFAEELGWLPRVVKHHIATLRGEPQVTMPMLAHKWWKTHPELACPDTEISLWIDGSIEVLITDYVERCLRSLGDDDWAMVPHPHRRCIHPEASFSATLARYDATSILAQASFYRSIGHPEGWGLMATGANVRRHTAAVLEVGDQWWIECLNWSHQDQLSLPVLLRLNEEKVRYNYNLPWHLWWRLHHHG
jgi:hypothetical protein